MGLYRVCPITFSPVSMLMTTIGGKNNLKSVDINWHCLKMRMTPSKALLSSLGADHITFCQCHRIIVASPG